MLEQRCNQSKQYLNNVATPYCGVREKSWLRIRVNVRIFNQSKIRPVAFLTFSLLSLSRHRKFPGKNGKWVPCCHEQAKSPKLYSSRLVQSVHGQVAQNQSHVARYLESFNFV